MNKRAEVYACLYAREFPSQALLRLRPELRNMPCVVVEDKPPLQLACSLNSKARRLGIGHGMTKVEVETFPTVCTLARSLSEEAMTKAAVLECAGVFSPRIEEQSTNTDFLCVIDITGTERLFGSPRTLAQDLLQRVEALGISASATISNNFHTAICVARGASRSEVTVIVSREESAALASLPLSVLNLSEVHAEIFALWGIHTLGGLAALPERELIARMGQEGGRLRQLARGELPHLFVPIEPKFRLEEQMELETPVELLNSLLFVISVLLEQLIIRAAARMVALASVTIALSLEGNTSHTRTVRTALPTNDKQVWIKLLHLDLEAHPYQAPVLSLRLCAESGSTSKVQLGLFSPQLPEPVRLDVTLARIRAIVGEEYVGSPVLKDAHQPDTFRIEPFTVSSAVSSPAKTQMASVAMRWLRPAENISVTLCSQRPVSFNFRHKRYDVEHSYGPWSMSGEWWNSMLWRCEQWDLIARSQDGSPLSCCLVRDVGKNTYQIVALYD